MTSYISNTNNNKLFGLRPEGVTPNTIVITYTVCEGDIHKAVTTMFDRGTSVHYTLKPDGYQHQHHGEDAVAFYAGKSSWHGVSGVNGYGIGIMLANDAHSLFPDAQTDKLIDLIKDINLRHNMTMEVVGLGEVALDRHIAPGKLFPWGKLAENGIGKHVQVPAEIDTTCKVFPGDKNDIVNHIQHNLIDLGYGISVTGEYDDLTSKTINVFGNRYLGQDLECWTDTAEYVLNELLGLDNSALLPGVEYSSDL